MTLETEIADRALRADELVRSGRAQLREAVLEGQRHGLSQRRIAALTGRSQPEVGRILRESEAARRSWMTARTVAEAIKTEVQRGDDDFALRMLVQAINDFRNLSAPDDIEDFLRRPRPTGDLRWDTLLAAAVARACRKRDLPPPAWTRRKPLKSWWFPVGGGGLLAARTMQRTPVDFARLGIWLDASAFQTA
jgi:hypothetical protein